MDVLHHKRLGCSAVYDKDFLRRDESGGFFNHQKDKFSYIPLDPVANYVYIADLNNRLRVG